MAKLNLRNPIIFFDLETTGTDISNDRIVEISLIKVFPDGHDEEYTKRVNPEMHIPESSSAIHGIYDADVAFAPTFKEIAKEVARIFEGCDVAGFNSNRFDIPLLVEELLRAGVQDLDLRKHKFVDVQNLYHKLERRTLVAAYKYYCGKNLEDAHSANADTRATYEVLKAQLDWADPNYQMDPKVIDRTEYLENLKNDVDVLSEFSTMSKIVDFAGRMAYNENGEEIFTFGKYKGMKVADVLRRDSGYFGWMLQGDFTLDTKRELMKIRLRELGR